jgi:2-amino-4-hydroxy-6-hydroxymethyldihydropteridine diphosphokinase
MEVEMHSFYVSIGSNLGDRLTHLRSGIKDLQNNKCEIVNFSSVYETAAIGMGEAPAFYNACIFGRTTLNAYEFMDHLLAVELQNGRNRSLPGVNSRTLDLDIVLFGELVVQTEHLHLPHPRYRDRKFVLLPLLEITPELIDPEEMKPVSHYLVQTSDDSEVKKLEISLFD